MAQAIVHDPATRISFKDSSFNSVQSWNGKSVQKIDSSYWNKEAFHAGGSTPEMMEFFTFELLPILFAAFLGFVVAMTIIFTLLAVGLAGATASIVLPQLLIPSLIVLGIGLTLLALTYLPPSKQIKKN